MQNSRNVGLDFLRAVAIFLVMGLHMRVCPESVNSVLHQITAFLSVGGWIGVDLFFVLSGFLVSGILFREHQRLGTIDLKRFFIRRGFKLYPVFWVFFGVSMLVKPNAPLSDVFGEILFLQNYLGKLWVHTWSLAVEEHFYILLGFLLFFLLKRKSADGSFSKIPVLFFIIALVCLLLRAEVVISRPFNYSQHLLASHLRIDSLMFGVLLSWMWHYENLAETIHSGRSQVIYCLSGVLLLLPAFFFGIKSTPWIPVLGITLFYLGSGALMLGLLQAKAMKHTSAKQIARIGMYSYSIYLWHQPINEWVQALMVTNQSDYNWYLYAGVYLAGSLIVGYATARAIEYPVLKFRDRVFPSHSNIFKVEANSLAD